ncbi:MAG: di/tricarboxylate transporter [Verrucomicrobiales bacterium]|jgi:di/tricarboxylate transporter
MIDGLNLHNGITLIVTAVAVILFARDWIPLETSAFAVLIFLVLFFQFFPFEIAGKRLTPTAFFSGFGHQALVSICALMIMGHGLEKTGALQPVASAMARLWPRHSSFALLGTLVLGAILSAFVNNTPVVVMLLPMLVAVGLKNDLSTTGILMPMGFATSIGGMATTIGSSTNLLVVTLAADMGLRQFSMFDFVLPVAIAGSVGILFLWAVAPRILPQRKPPLTDTSPRIFTGVLGINAGSSIANKTLAQALELTGGRMRIERIRRGEDSYVMKLPTVSLLPGDQLEVNDTPENLKDFERELGATLSSETATEGEGTQKEVLAEIAIMSGSFLDNRTLNGVAFDTRFNLKPVAFHRSGSGEQTRGIGAQRLRAGDILLIQGSQANIDELKQTGEILLLDGAIDIPVHRKSKIALGIMAAVVFIAALGFAPISVAAVAGVFAMLLSRCIVWADVADALSIPVIMIIVASLALGSALLQTGGATYLAGLFLGATSELPWVAILAALMIVMSIATNVVSNNAAAIIGTPIAVDIARGLGAPVEPFLLAVMFGANMSFATPIGYQTNLLVMSAGGYKFSDFIRIGLPLTLIMWFVFSAILPIIYDL